MYIYIAGSFVGDGTTGSNELSGVAAIEIGKAMQIESLGSWTTLTWLENPLRALRFIGRVVEW